MRGEGNGGAATTRFGRIDIGYDPAALRVGAAHLGVGAFHRAHQAVYFDRLAKLGRRDWGLVGMNLAPPDLTAAHEAQAGRYAVLSRDGGGTEATAVGVFRRYVDAARAGPPLDLLTDPAIAFVTLTITEKGYGARAGGDGLDPDGAAMRDLAAPDAPRTAVGVLAEMLRRRRDAGLGGVTLASCDNVSENGALLSAVLLDYAGRADPALAAWIAREARFPTSMVDRIVPAMDDAARAELEAAAGRPDALGVAAEPFMQWAIADDFAQGRPPLEEAGVEVTAHVGRYERMKHRILNGCQSALSHAGWLAGCATTFEAASDPALAEYARRFMALQARTVAAPPGVDLAAYAETTMARLRNPMIRHAVTQIGTDSSFKLRQRIAGPAAELLAAGGPTRLHAFTLAAWIAFASGRAPDGRIHAAPDPLAEIMRALAARHAGDAPATAAAFLTLDPVPAALAGSEVFRGQVAEALAAIGSRPFHAALAEALAEA